MPAKPVDTTQPPNTEAKQRTMYVNLFYEMQFRATKNALMNYNEADNLEDTSRFIKMVTNGLTGLSASGILASLVQKGSKLTSSKAGVAGILGLPICGIVQVINSSTSEFLPSYTERAKKHVTAAAKWNYVSERARAARLRMLADPKFDIDKAKDLHEELLQKKEEVSKLVLISRQTIKEFGSSSEQVFLAMKKRKDAFRDFEDFDKKHNYSVSDVKNAEDLYF